MEDPVHGYAPQIAYNSINGGKNINAEDRKAAALAMEM